MFKKNTIEQMENKVRFQLKNDDRCNTDSCNEPALIEKEDNRSYDQCEIGMRIKHDRDEVSKLGKLTNMHIDPSQNQLLHDMPFDDKNMMKFTSDFLRPNTEKDVAEIPVTTEDYL